MAIKRIQHKRASSSVWSRENPLLLSGELGIETDTLKLKVGDGVHCWDDLGYIMQDLIDGLLTRLEKLEEQITKICSTDDTASDVDVNTMLDEVFSSGEVLNSNPLDDERL